MTATAGTHTAAAAPNHFPVDISITSGLVTSVDRGANGAPTGVQSIANAPGRAASREALRASLALRGHTTSV